jgi:hypothetical protein
MDSEDMRSGFLRAGVLAFLAALAAAVAVPATASAAVSCNLAAGTLSVHVTGTGDQIAALRLEPDQTTIGVYTALDFSGAAANCGTTPTTANTNTIDVTDDEGGTSQRTVFKVSLENGPFVNSDATGEGTGTKEIEITYDGAGNSTDDLILEGGPGPAGDNWQMGAIGSEGGYQLDAGETGTVDVDDLVTTSVEQLQVGINDNPGDDILDARGTGPGFTGPLDPGSSVRQLVGAGGDDQIYAGAGNNWRLEGDGGSDTLVGGPGDDTLWMSFGADADTGQGNGGTDMCTYQNHNDPVAVDLRVTTPQDTGGAGIDTLSGCEDLTGSNGSDTLIGTPGPNTIGGGAGTGDDTLMGLSGDDILDGTGGSDTVSYAQGSIGGLNVDLGITVSQDTNGAGHDTITNTENLIGGPFADNLTGDAGPNRIDGYDGIFDNIDCAGDGGDVAIADEIGVDILSNCETVDHAPRASVGAGPGDTALINDPTPTYSLLADETSTFEVKVDSGQFQACPASCTVPTLADGVHTLAFRAVDVDENQHPGLNPVQRTVTVDTVAPAVKIVSAPSGATADATPTIGFSVGDATAFQCRVDGAAFGACSGPGTSHTTASLSDGKHSFDVRGTDAAGNAAVAHAQLTVDTRAPVTTLKKPKVRGSKVKLKFSADEAGSTFACKLDRGKAGPCASPKSYKRLKPGRHRFVVVATDAAGNAGAAVKARFKVR